MYTSARTLYHFQQVLCNEHELLSVTILFVQFSGTNNQQLIHRVLFNSVFVCICTATLLLMTDMLSPLG